MGHSEPGWYPTQIRVNPNREVHPSTQYTRPIIIYPVGFVYHPNIFRQFLPPKCVEYPPGPLFRFQQGYYCYIKKLDKVSWYAAVWEVCLRIICISIRFFKGRTLMKLTHITNKKKYLQRIIVMSSIGATALSIIILNEG